MGEGFWSWLSRRLPRRLVYHAIMRAWAHATTGRYGKTIAPGVLCAEVVRRWARDAGMPGHGPADERSEEGR